MSEVLHLDIETFSSVDLKSSGVYKYCESIDFEILLIGYAIGGSPVEAIDLASGEEIPEWLLDMMIDPNVEKHAHNAMFERVCFRATGIDIPIDQWTCSLVKAAYCGYPLSLDQASKALGLGKDAKMSSGKELIKYFCSPIKPTAVNGMRKRNLPEHDTEKWSEFKEYCKGDVRAERSISFRLEGYEFPEFEKINYIIDQEINDEGILIDLDLAAKAYKTDLKYSKETRSRVREITQVDNPNSPAQLKEWIGDAIGENIKSLAKDAIPLLVQKTESAAVLEVLDLRTKLAKSSTKKYISMLNCACSNNRAHGLFQFYGANRTGRWAGRLIQMQNLPQNHMEGIAQAREIIKKGDYGLIKMVYDNVPLVLSELIRTTFIPPEGYMLAVADFSAIEARVLAWIAQEDWRLEVFRSHGKIYEASASMMFGVPIEEVTKGSDLRQKGKTAELALGYQGSVGAMKQMGGEGMGLSESEMDAIVKRWRRANPKIKDFWEEMNAKALRTVKFKRKFASKFVSFDYEDGAMAILLPSGKKLYYQNPRISTNRFGMECVEFQGIDQYGWNYIETYGGKLTENIVQAISRDILADSMIRLRKAKKKMVMHVHDEVVAEVKADQAQAELEDMCRIMGEDIPWAPGLPLGADGYVTEFYIKD